jgi:hypothetical protein
MPQIETSRPAIAERAAALLSLLALVADIGWLVVGVVLHLTTALVSIVGLLVCVTAGWYVVSRRGMIRVAALIAMTVALGVLIAGLVLANLSVLRMFLIFVLAVVSLASAGYALRAKAAALGTAGHLRPASAAEHPVLIMNLKSGGGKAERFRLAEECRKRGIEPVVLRPGDDLLQLAEDAVARGADVIGMAGGDGSQALIATVAARHGIPHVCVPAGTRNHFALDLGLDREDVIGALEAFADGVGAPSSSPGRARSGSACLATPSGSPRPRGPCGCCPARRSRNWAGWRPACRPLRPTQPISNIREVSSLAKPPVAPKITSASTRFVVISGARGGLRGRDDAAADGSRIGCLSRRDPVLPGG